MINDLTRLQRRRDMFIKAIGEMEVAEEEHRSILGAGYSEPQSLVWAKRDLAATIADIERLQRGDRDGVAFDV